MESIILNGISTDELKKILREVLEENNKKESKPKQSFKNLSYLNRFDVAALLKVSLPTLNNWSKSGILQSHRIGNRVLYKSDEIDQAVHAVKNLKYKRG